MGPMENAHASRYGEAYHFILEEKTMSHLPSASCDLQFQGAIQRWDEALPLGNGFCGALVWGPSEGLRFSLDRGDLWDPTPYNGVYQEEFSYANMVRLAREGKEDEIRRIFDTPYHYPVPTKLPAGKLILHFEKDLPQRSALSLATAEAQVWIGEIQLRAFVHAEEPYGMICVDCSPESFSLEIDRPQYGLDTGENEPLQMHHELTPSLELLRYPPAETGEDGELRWFTQKITGGMEYGIFAQIHPVGQKTWIAWSVASSLDGDDWKQRVRENLRRALAEGYENNLARHARWWAEHWEQSGVTLPDPLFEKNWYLGHYFLACCSRKGCYPMPLQGVWTADDGQLPPWKGDYHHDLNTQLSYYSYAKAGHFAEGESFLDYLWNMRDCAREFAQRFFHGKGICLPGVMSQDGVPLGGFAMYALSPTNQLWLCQSFERHWRFTGDDVFLRERAYPYLCETAEFLLSIVEERDGLYYLPISSSPEIHDDTIRAFLTPNSNYDLSLMQYLFRSLAEMSAYLEDGRKAEWEGHLAKLPQLAVSDRNVLMLDRKETLEESHRHLSHAMAVHPLRLLSYDVPEEQKIIDETILDLERLGTGNWMGYTFAWMAELYAVQRNGNGAAYQLQVFWNNYCSVNGFHLNGDYRCRGTGCSHYRPFTLEGNMCAVDALQEMLLQSEGNCLRLFPAIPDEWRETQVAFRDLRAERGLRVSAKWSGGKVSALTLRAARDCTVSFYPQAGLDALLPQSARRDDGRFVLSMAAGQVLELG